MSADELAKVKESVEAELEKARASLKAIDASIGQSTVSPETLPKCFRNRKNSEGKMKQRWSNSPLGQGKRKGHWEDAKERRNKHGRYLNANSGNNYEGSPAGKELVVNVRGRGSPRYRNVRFGNKSTPRKSLMSTKSREETIGGLVIDERVRERNKRMFNALFLGTLNKFNEEQKNFSEKEQRMYSVQAKLEEEAERERHENRLKQIEQRKEERTKKCDLAWLELKAKRLAKFDEWAISVRTLCGFLLTQAEPQIYYKPKYLTPNMEHEMKTSRLELEKTIYKKRQILLKDLEDFKAKKLDVRVRRLDMDVEEDQQIFQMEVETEFLQFVENTTEMDGF